MHLLNLNVMIVCEGMVNTFANRDQDVVVLVLELLTWLVVNKDDIEGVKHTKILKIVFKEFSKQPDRSFYYVYQKLM